jgi:acetylornithine/succinyldiaminopimelate/putrescine aminotransferase
MPHAAETGAHFLNGLRELQNEFPTLVEEARGLGLMTALAFKQPIARVMLAHLMEAGIVANAVSDTTMRFVPPLVVTNADCDRVVAALRSGLRSQF